MKINLAITLLGLASLQCSAFSPSNSFNSASISRQQSSSLGMAYELVAEPEGGEEIQAVATMTGSRMKNMGKNTSLKSDKGEVYTFWLNAIADGKMIAEYRKTVEKDASKKANFPGFRKGQVPPYAQPQLTMFAVQEGIIKTCESAVAAYGLKALPGSDGSVEVHEDIKDICKGFKVGSSVEFTATFAAVFDPEKAEQNKDDEVSEVAEEAPVEE